MQITSSKTEVITEMLLWHNTFVAREMNNIGIECVVIMKYDDKMVY